ncbi:MAG: hypothetical protein UZ21_OP11001000778 [Microgenomates bacterium OLB22]|nr:MAG: hypothetical protein UZ21_OP11001000778 [Microgenomates bacterium OLB22]
MRLIEKREEAVPELIDANKIVGRQLRFNAQHQLPTRGGKGLSFAIYEPIQRDTFLLNMGFWQQYALVRMNEEIDTVPLPRKGILGALGFTENRPIGIKASYVFKWDAAAYAGKRGPYHVWYHTTHKFYIVMDESETGALSLFLFMDEDAELERLLERQPDYSVYKMMPARALMIASAAGVCYSPRPTLMI